MPASLVSLDIRGIRSYSPYEYKTQSIEFMPLTLIVGANGSGKTSIIEALKFMISGEEPPLSDCRRNFLHMGGNSAKNFDKSVAYASIKLEFITSRDEKCVAKREIYRAGLAKGSTPSVSSNYRIANKPSFQVHKQDDWLKTVPKLFNLPNQALLNNVILCHQENSLWCMGDSSTVKQIFDKIFGCEHYKKEIKHMDAEMKSCKSEQSIVERDIVHLNEKLEQLKRLEREMRKSVGENEDLISKIHELDEEIKESAAIRIEIEDKISRSKQDTSDLEDKLLLESQKLARNASSLQATCQGLIQRLKVKENYVKRLSDQLNQTSPIAKDLAKVIENLDQMTFITAEMPQSLEVDSLNNLINASEKLVNNVMNTFQSENVSKIKEDIEKENCEIQNNKTQLKSNESQLEQLSNMQAKAQEEYNQARSASKANTTGQDELKNIERKIMELREQRSRFVGTRSQLQKDISRYSSELKDMSNIKTRLAESIGKLVCNKIIVRDLEKLKECFQHSITSFHDQMIAKINEVLKVRWRQIYQGKDIDTIELIDEEVTKGKDKKSYNYYIALRKGGERMKMREKSSAGQRALASIILRMTLAELFVKDFAFIALDEPTANLDHANVRSLAKSIGNYVKMRSSKGINIQWIIITHDEHFLNSLDEECSPFYYRTQLDNEGCSKIVKISCKDFQSGFNNDARHDN